MLAIRMQRRGRKNQAQYRLVVQDSRHHPTSGRIIAFVGTYNPHTKEAVIEADKIKTYLTNGAQPSPRIAQLLKNQGVKMPSWVNITKSPKKSAKNPDKLRKNQPKVELPKTESVAEVDVAESEVKKEESITSSESTAVDNKSDDKAPKSTEDKVEKVAKPTPEEKSNA